MALASRPDFAECHFNLGGIYARQGQLDSAVEAFKRAIQIRPGFTEAQYNLGTVYARQGRWESAILQYNKTVSLQPEHVKAYRGLAAVYQQKGMEKEAREASETATRLESGSNRNRVPNKQ